jgi:hypothetical protein
MKPTILGPVLGMYYTENSNIKNKHILNNINSVIQSNFEVLHLLRVPAMTVVVAHRTVEGTATNLSFYAHFHYWTYRYLAARLLFCEAEYIREKNSTHESLLISPLRYEYGLQRLDDRSTEYTRYRGKHRPSLE